MTETAQASPDAASDGAVSDGAVSDGASDAVATFDAGLRARLEVVETELLSAAEAGTPLVTGAAQHVIAAGGKRFRPVLVLLSSAFGSDPDEADLVRAATVVELTHVASLYHDDVMDGAELRRGAPSANATWDNTVAILVGDYLFARASDVVSELGPEFVRIQARTFARLVQGQIAETVGPPEGVDPLAHYLQVLADKTGALIATSALFGAKISGATPAVQQLLSRFGEEIGLIFQLSDDIIDVTSDDTGKTPGTDLREGIATLPTLLAATSTDPADARLLELLGSDLHDETALAEALQLLRAHPAVEEARTLVRTRSAAAAELLSPLPDGPAKAALLELCDSVVSRTT